MFQKARVDIGKTFSAPLMVAYRYGKRWPKINLANNSTEFFRQEFFLEGSIRAQNDESESSSRASQSQKIWTFEKSNGSAVNGASNTMNRTGVHL